MTTSTDIYGRLGEIEDEYIRISIARCNELLEKNFGTHWPDQINTDILDINDCTVCILGQLTSCRNFREWAEECRKLGILPLLAHDYALDVTTQSWLQGDYETRKELLESEWRKVLR